MLKDSGKLSHEIAAKIAENQYEKYRLIQDRLYESDFDKLIKKLPNKESNDNN